MGDATTPYDFKVFTLFPSLFDGFLSESILNRALVRGLLSVEIHNIRDYATDRHRTCDGTPYGGGGGMVLRPEPIYAAVEHVLGSAGTDATPAQASMPIVLLTPQGRLFNQRVAAELSQLPGLALICGRYEGVDERVRTDLVTDEISIGDYVLGGGEVAAMVVIEAVSRLLPDVLGHAESARRDSHSPGLEGLLEGPHYTRPANFRGMAIPEVLVGGHHARVARWKRDQSLLRTAQRRPELLAGAVLDREDRRILREHGYDPDALVGVGQG